MWLIYRVVVYDVAICKSIRVRAKAADRGHKGGFQVLLAHGGWVVPKNASTCRYLLNGQSHLVWSHFSPYRHYCLGRDTVDLIIQNHVYINEWSQFWALCTRTTRVARSSVKTFTSTAQSWVNRLVIYYLGKRWSCLKKFGIVTALSGLSHSATSLCFPRRLRCTLKRHMVYAGVNQFSTLTSFHFSTLRIYASTTTW